MSHDESFEGDRNGDRRRDGGRGTTDVLAGGAADELDAAVASIRRRADRRFAAGRVALAVGLLAAAAGLGYLAVVAPPGGARPMGSAAHPVLAALAYPPYGLAMAGLALTMVGAALVLTAPDLHAAERRLLREGIED